MALPDPPASEPPPTQPGTPEHSARSALTQAQAQADAAFAKALHHMNVLQAMKEQALANATSQSPFAMIPTSKEEQYDPKTVAANTEGDF